MKEKQIDEYVKEKAKEAIQLHTEYFPKYDFEIEAWKDFIRQIIKDCQPRASREEIDDIALAVWATSDTIEAIEKLEEWLELKSMEVID